MLGPKKLLAKQMLNQKNYEHKINYKIDFATVLTIEGYYEFHRNWMVYIDVS